MLKTLICWLLGHDWYDYGESEYACSRCGYDDPNNRNRTIVKIVHFGKQMERKAGEICH